MHFHKQQEDESKNQKKKKKKKAKTTNSWKVNNLLWKNQLIIEEINEEIKRY